MKVLFNTIVASLQAGDYIRIRPDGSVVFVFVTDPIVDEANLFEESTKTLMYYWCVANNESRWMDYYSDVCVPSNVPIPSMSSVPFSEIVRIVSFE